MKKPLRTEVGKGFSSCTSCMMFLGMLCLSLAFWGELVLKPKLHGQMTVIFQILL